MLLAICANFDKALTLLEKAKYVISKREDKPTTTKPNAPFITSTLQQAASTRLGFGVKKTMMLAQRLYEAGHITYMRTDSTNLSAEAVSSCRDYIAKTYSKKYLPQNPVSYASKEGAQEALALLDEAHTRVNGARADMGAAVLFDARPTPEAAHRRHLRLRRQPRRHRRTLVRVHDRRCQRRGRLGRGPQLRCPPR